MDKTNILGSIPSAAAPDDLRQGKFWALLLSAGAVSLHIGMYGRGPSAGKCYRRVGRWLESEQSLPLMDHWLRACQGEVDEVTEVTVHLECLQMEGSYSPSGLRECSQKGLLDTDRTQKPVQVLQRLLAGGEGVFVQDLGKVQ